MISTHSGMWRRVVEQRFPDVSKYRSALRVMDQSGNFVCLIFFFILCNFCATGTPIYREVLALCVDYVFDIPDLIKFP